MKNGRFDCLGCERAHQEANELRAENAALRERLRRIRAAVPRGDDVDESGERLHNYERVSEATVKRCEEFSDLRKWRVLHRRPR